MVSEWRGSLTQNRRNDNLTLKNMTQLYTILGPVGLFWRNNACMCRGSVVVIGMRFDFRWTQCSGEVWSSFSEASQKTDKVDVNHRTPLRHHSFRNRPVENNNNSASEGALSSLQTGRCALVDTAAKNTFFLYDMYVTISSTYVLSMPWYVRYVPQPTLPISRKALLEAHGNFLRDFRGKPLKKHTDFFSVTYLSLCDTIVSHEARKTKRYINTYVRVGSPWILHKLRGHIPNGRPAVLRSNRPGTVVSAFLSERQEI